MNEQEWKSRDRFRQFELRAIEGALVHKAAARSSQRHGGASSGPRSYGRSHTGLKGSAADILVASGSFAPSATFGDRERGLADVERARVCWNIDRKLKSIDRGEVPRACDGPNGPGAGATICPAA